MENKIKDNKEKKIVLWEGFRKELPWILFWALLIIMSYGYYQDKKICEEVLADPCSACYSLNKTMMDSDYLKEYTISDDIPKYKDVYINESAIPIEDKNPNSRTISIYE